MKLSPVRCGGGGGKRGGLYVWVWVLRGLRQMAGAGADGCCAAFENMCGAVALPHTTSALARACCQVAVIEAAQNILGQKDAASEEFVKDTKNPVIVFMPEGSKTHMGGTMRLGTRRTVLKDDKCITGWIIQTTRQCAVALAVAGRITIAIALTIPIAIEMSLGDTFHGY